MPDYFKILTNSPDNCKDVREFSSPPDTLSVNQIFVYYFRCLIPNVIHLLHPKHLILSLEVFGNILTLGKLFYQLKKHSFRLFVQIAKITVQFIVNQQLCVQRLVVLPEISQMPLAPYADGFPLFIGELQTESVIIILQRVPKPVLLVVNVLIHDVILQIRLIPAIQSFWLIAKAEGRQLPYEVPPFGGPFMFAVCIYFTVPQVEQRVTVWVSDSWWMTSAG